MNDPYRTLGVSPSVTKAEIKAAYRRLARQWHPDLHKQDPTATRRFREINEAYRELSSRARTHAYTQPVPDDAPIWQSEPGPAYAPGSSTGSRRREQARSHPAAGFRPAPAYAGAGAPMGSANGYPGAPSALDPIDAFASDILQDVDDIGRFFSDLFTLDDDPSRPA